VFAHGSTNEQSHEEAQRIFDYALEESRMRAKKF
jgi:hypothetical protein